MWGVSEYVRRWWGCIERRNGDKWEGWVGFVLGADFGMAYVLREIMLIAMRGCVLRRRSLVVRVALGAVLAAMALGGCVCRAQVVAATSLRRCLRWLR